MKITSVGQAHQCLYIAGKHTNYNCPNIKLTLSSAGVGRTGTFIAIDTEVQRIRREGVVDVYNCVHKMRYWRNSMIQTLVSQLYCICLGVGQCNPLVTSVYIR